MTFHRENAVYAAAQYAAEEHLKRLEELLDRENSGEDVEWPADLQDPYCGCMTCQIRETLNAAWAILAPPLTEDAPPVLPAALDPYPFPWTATLIREGKMLTDYRVCERDSIVWSKLPLPVVLAFTVDRIDIEPIGRIDEIWREGELLRARGVADRELAGEGAGIEITVEESQIGFSDDGRHEFFYVTKGTLRSVCVVANPADDEAQFDVPLHLAEPLTETVQGDRGDTPL